MVVTYGIGIPLTPAEIAELAEGYTDIGNVHVTVDDPRDKRLRMQFHPDLVRQPPSTPRRRLP
jgi:hypothetical protein